MRRLTKKLQKLHLTAKHDTDYVELSSTVSILDMALDLCLPPTPSPPSAPETKAKASDEDSIFNQRVDELAQEVKAVFSRIPDAGAGHISRTEAKEVLNRVHYRIAYGVRTKPRPKKNLFEEPTLAKGDNSLPRVEGPMARFLNRKKDDKVT